MGALGAPRQSPAPAGHLAPLTLPSTGQPTVPAASFSPLPPFSPTRLPGAIWPPGRWHLPRRLCLAVPRARQLSAWRLRRSSAARRSCGAYRPRGPVHIGRGAGRKVPPGARSPSKEHGPCWPDDRVPGLWGRAPLHRARSPQDRSQSLRGAHLQTKITNGRAHFARRTGARVALDVPSAVTSSSLPIPCDRLIRRSQGSRRPHS